MAAVVSLFAITFLWPSAVAFPVELRAIAACRAIAARIRAEIAWMIDGGAELEAAQDAASADADAAVGALDKLFLGTPYRPTGLSTKARAEIRLVDELRWLSGVVLRSGVRMRARRTRTARCAASKLAAADVLERAAPALEATGATAPAPLRAARDRPHARCATP